MQTGMLSQDFLIVKERTVPDSGRRLLPGNYDSDSFIHNLAPTLYVFAS